MQIVELPIEGISQITNGLTATKNFIYSTVYDEENYQDLICSLKKEGESSIIESKRFRYEYDIQPRSQNDIIELENFEDNVMMLELLMTEPINNTEISYNMTNFVFPTSKITVDNSSFDISMNMGKQILIQIQSKISIINVRRLNSLIRIKSTSKLTF